MSGKAQKGANQESNHSGKNFAHLRNTDDKSVRQIADNGGLAAPVHYANTDRCGVGCNFTQRAVPAQVPTEPHAYPTGLESTHRCDLGTRVLRGLEVWTEQFRKYRSGLANFSTLTRSPLPL